MRRSLARAALLALVAAASLAIGESTAFAQRGGHEEISMAVGETRTLPAVGVEGFTEAVKGIVDVVPTSGALILNAKKAGSTTLVLVKNDRSQVSYDITVSNRNTSAVTSEIQQLIEPFPGVKSRRVGTRIFLEGAVPTDADLKRVQQITTVYPGQVESLVTVGVADRKLLIRLDFFFVQYSTTSGYNVGVGWPSNIGGTTAAGAPVVQSNLSFDFISRTTQTAQASVVNQPLPRLDIASRYGWAKVLKQSSVITANGNEASFASGGEANFLATGLTVGLVSVKFGTNVVVLPRYDSATRDVEIKLTADVSDLSAASSANGPPGRTTTNLQTQVTLKLGQALVLSGIRTQNQQHAVSGIPLLSEIPVLGVLFGTHGHEKQDTEGAVFIVPSVVDSVSKSALDLIRFSMETYDDYKGNLSQVRTFTPIPATVK